MQKAQSDEKVFEDIDNLKPGLATLNYVADTFAKLRREAHIVDAEDKVAESEATIKALAEENANSADIILRLEAAAKDAEVQAAESATTIQRLEQEAQAKDAAHAAALNAIVKGSAGSPGSVDSAAIIARLEAAAKDAEVKAVESATTIQRLEQEAQAKDAAYAAAINAMVKAQQASATAYSAELVELQRINTALQSSNTCFPEEALPCFPELDPRED